MLVSIRDLYKSYRRGGGFSRASISALRGVDFYIDRGDRVAVVGESGSGKSTLGKCIAGWEQPDGGEIRFAPSVSTQLIPQNPGESLNPRLTVREIVEEPYRIRRENVAPREGANRWMHETGLEPGAESRRPDELSGGQRARAAIARALAAVERSSGALLIFDESFSSLDLPLQERLLELLARLQTNLELTYLLISHDLTLVSRFVREIAVMDAGRIIERDSVATLMTAPRTGAARSLVSISTQGLRQAW